MFYACKRQSVHLLLCLLSSAGVFLFILSAWVGNSGEIVECEVESDEVAAIMFADIIKG